MIDFARTPNVPNSLLSIVKVLFVCKGLRLYVPVNNFSVSIVKVGFAGVYIIFFLILALKHVGSSLEPPHLGFLRVATMYVLGR